MLKIGERAPVFELPNCENESVSLSDYLGKKIILLLCSNLINPKCRSIVRALKNNYEKIIGKETELLCISSGDILLCQEAKKQLAIPFEVLSDDKIVAIRGYKAYRYHSAGCYQRMRVENVAYVIDEKGNIEKAFDKVTNKNVKEILLEVWND